MQSSSCRNKSGNSSRIDPLLRGTQFGDHLDRRWMRTIGLRRRLDRQPHAKPRPAALLAFDRDVAAVQIDHHLNEIEPDAGADDSGHVAAAEITLEKLADVRGRNADAIIFDRHREPPALGLRLNPDDAATG